MTRDELISKLQESISERGVDVTLPRGYITTAIKLLSKQPTVEEIEGIIKNEIIKNAWTKTIVTRKLATALHGLITREEV